MAVSTADSMAALKVGGLGSQWAAQLATVLVARKVVLLESLKVAQKDFL